MEEGMEYILEIASSVEYKDSKKFEIKGAASEYTVENLRSNFRNYARLYAYNPDKKLDSEPTRSVTVRTLRSSDDYDSGEDTEDEISGEIVEKDSWAVNGVWTVRITGVNADRFIQQVQTDSKLDYSLNLKVMPAGTKKISVLVSLRVFTALNKLGENLLIKSQRNTLVIRPGMLTDDIVMYGTSAKDATVEFEITLDSSSTGSNIKNLNFKTPVSELEVRVSDGIAIPVESFEKPLKVIYEYTAAEWYKQDVTAGYILTVDTSVWKKYNASGIFDADSGMGSLSFETFDAGKMAVGEPGNNYYDDISRSYAVKAIVNVASVHDLKSVAGRKFEPDKYLTIGAGAKFMLDILDLEYGSNYMVLAVKSGIVQNADRSKTASNCTREKFIAMVIRVCELKTSQKAKATINDAGIYKDISQVNAVLLPKINYAQEIGVITSRFSDTLGPKDPITRGEAMVLTEKLLRYAGEL